MEVPVPIPKDAPTPIPIPMDAPSPHGCPNPQSPWMPPSPWRSPSPVRVLGELLASRGGVPGSHPFAVGLGEPAQLALRLGEVQQHHCGERRGASGEWVPSLGDATRTSGRPQDLQVPPIHPAASWTRGCPWDPWMSPGPMDTPRTHGCPHHLQPLPGPPDVPWTHGYPHSQQTPHEKTPTRRPPRAEGKPRQRSAPCRGQADLP